MPSCACGSPGQNGNRIKAIDNGRSRGKDPLIYGRPIHSTHRHNGKTQWIVETPSFIAIVNFMFSKKKYQMPNIEELVDKIGQIILSERPGQVWLTVLDLKYAYWQLSLSQALAAQCNFSIVGGAATIT